MSKLARRQEHLPSPQNLVRSARSFAMSARSRATARAYHRAFFAFDSWCATHGLKSLPAHPRVLALYLTALAEQGRSVATIEQALAAISEVHRATAGESPRSAPEVREVLKGIRRRRGTVPSQKAPITVPELRRMLETVPDGLLGLRDRALLLVGFAGAFRRSELVGLDVGDLTFTDDGVEVLLRRSKVDQEARGRKVGIPFGSTPHTCPVRALKAWLDAAKISEGPAFRSVNRHGRVGDRLSGRAVALVVKRRAEATGLDASRFAGHSLRSGLATSAAKAGKSERSIMAQTGHRSLVMVRRYIRDGSLFTENAAAGLL